MHQKGSLVTFKCGLHMPGAVRSDRHCGPGRQPQRGNVAGARDRVMLACVRMIVDTAHESDKVVSEQQCKTSLDSLREVTQCA